MTARQQLGISGSLDQHGSCEIVPGEADAEDEQAAFEGDFFGSAEEYGHGDLPFPRDDGDTEDHVNVDHDPVDESSDDEGSEEDAVGRDVLRPSNEVQRDGHPLQPPIPEVPLRSSPASNADDEHDMAEGQVPDDASQAGPSGAPGGLDPDAHEQIRRAPAYVVPFGGAAGAPVPPESGQAPEAGYTEYEGTVDPKAANPYAPFASKMDWEIAHWAKLRGSGSTAFSDLLAIPEVRERLGLSYKNSDGLNKIIDEQLPNRRPMFHQFEVTINGEHLTCSNATYSSARVLSG
ncbi:uncharacterized protein B0H18DRAFT_1126518 [Fomitopsis serialis]|uniref:uncharacterized protein n=1 Tax=Fomitopsis serialis TaxID=139415 RepID=UPI00200887BA|nr:uncharacterized protein B0H18DRAFT_1126518 [Neoantrodia serialis]KAH9913159.1 hypothetical protein B0H18DRAFT_1126518 [Neoantrodia serialis]